MFKVSQYLGLYDTRSHLFIRHSPVMTTIAVPPCWPLIPYHLSWDTAFPSRLHMRTARTQTACAFAQSDQSRRRALCGLPRSQSILSRTVKTDQIVRVRRLIWVFDGCTCNIIGNAVSRLICVLNYEHARFTTYQENTQRRNNVAPTSPQRTHNVVTTLLRRCYDVVC